MVYFRVKVSHQIAAKIGTLSLVLRVTHILNTYGPFKKYVTGLGGRGVKQNSDKQWQGGEGVESNSDVTAYEKILWKFYKLLIFCDEYQLPNCILFEFIFI